MAVTTNLYPPIVDTVMPAFLVGSESPEENTCRVYFSLSLFNAITEIENVQVTVRNQVTNKSALNATKYPSEVMLKELLVDEDKETNDKYYIEITPQDMENNNFVVDKYYKVQLRFTSKDVPTKPSLSTPQAIDAWLSSNLQYFSEWSTVCLIRGISTPLLYLQDFDGGITEIYSTIANTQIIGRLNFADENENETLNYYRVQLYDRLNNLLLDSGDIYTNDYTDVNSISYTINYDLTIQATYYFKLTYVTSNLYQNTEEYSFTVISADVPVPDIDLTVEEDEDNGSLRVQVNSSEGAIDLFTGSLIVRRASSKNDFNTWEDMFIQTFEDAPYIEFVWHDYTIESGTFYWYAVQAYDKTGTRSPMKKAADPKMVVFEDIFLTSGDKQLKIRFNPSLTSFKHTLSEVKIDTIGSKYPFIKRNGYVDYVQFPLGGLITSAMDGEGLFTSKTEIYKDMIPYYNAYNEEKNIPIWQDTVWEKKFRDKVMDFLYEDNLKLFRSPTEGNFIIRIMDLNFQPNQTLGRRLWAFSSNAYEMEDCTLENLYKYGIFINKGDTLYGSGDGEDESLLRPIRRVVFLDSEDEFPDEWMSQVLYVFDGQFYMWDETENIYYIISIPYWNNVDDPEDLKKCIGKGKTLYASKLDLYLWNRETKQFEKLSEIQELTEV